MDRIADRYYKSYDLAGAAFAVYVANLGFRWSDQPAGLARVRSVNELFSIRNLQSYEFVHLAAYLAGRQAERRGFPLVDGSDIREHALPKQVWNRRAIIPRGKVIYGIARAPMRWLALAEPCQVGISLGNGQLVCMSRNSNLTVQFADEVFPSWLYREVRFGDYDWLASQADPQGILGARRAEQIRTLSSQPLHASL